MSENEPFEEGYQAFIDGFLLSDCPYDDGIQVVEWEGGWINAEEEFGD